MPSLRESAGVQTLAVCKSTTKIDKQHTRPSCDLFLWGDRQLTGNESTITRIKYQLDDEHGNEILGDEDIRNATLTTVLDE